MVRIHFSWALSAFLNPPTADIVLLLTLVQISYLTCGLRSTWPTILKTMINDSVLSFLAVLASHVPMALFMVSGPVSVKM